MRAGPAGAGSPLRFEKYLETNLWSRGVPAAEEDEENLDDIIWW